MDVYLNRECESRELGFTYVHRIAHNNKFGTPHIDKDLFSVFLLLDGDLDYMIQGKRLHINPGDVVLVSSNELHHSILKEGSALDYILLMVNLDFFIKNSCTDFAYMVFNRVPGTNNIIPAQIVKESGIASIYEKLEIYTQETPVCLPVIKSVIIELMYNLNKQVRQTTNVAHYNDCIRRVIAYINQHLTEELSLDKIANSCFLTKQYLCRVFKKNTGFTVNQYICYQRISLVQTLCAKNISISEACMRAGFGSYSSFYRSFRKITKEQPRQNLYAYRLPLRT